VVQSRRVPTPPSTGSLVSVQCDQPPLIRFGVCGRKAKTKPSWWGVGLGRVVKKVSQHPDDHEFESQRWQ
jgi:hypothetical protein